MDERDFPGPAPDPGSFPGDDTDLDEFVAWLDREEAAGRNPVPPDRTPMASGISVSFGDGDGIDPELLAAVCGSYGTYGHIGADDEVLSSRFGQGRAADVLPPGPALAALTEAAVADVTRLTDDQLTGVLQAARRQQNREAWKMALVTAEFARRRESDFDLAAARGVPVHCRPGEYPGEELAMELLLSPVQAAHAIDDATDLRFRLPATLAGMAAGLIDEGRAGVIALHTRSLCAADATIADSILAALAPTLRVDQLLRKAAALEMKLAPEAVKARREHARQTRQRVEVRREESGNACVAGRELDTGDALASKAHIHGLALRLRRAGLAGTLDQLRLLVFADLTAGRDPLDRITGRAPSGPSGSAAASPAGRPSPGGQTAADPEQVKAENEAAPDVEEGMAQGEAAANAQAREASPPTGTAASLSLDYDHDEWDHRDGPGSDPPVRPPEPMPAAISLIVHDSTLFGWDTAPTEAGGWGLLDAEETRGIVAAAARHPATRWCVTVVGPDGTASAHGCSPGRHSWPPDHSHDQQESTGPPAPRDQQGSTGRPDPGDSATTADPRKPTPAQAARVAEFLRSLKLTLRPVAKGACDHAAAEPRYSPSRALTHLVRARTATCDAPGCTAQAVHADLDHTVAYPGGPTDQCNLGPKCRRHHKVKQGPGWQVAQSEPGVIRWTLPNSRTHVTKPTVYDLVPAPR
jgi:Domain of unknown function (DUF222)